MTRLGISRDDPFIVHRVVRLGRLSERRPFRFLARRGRRFTFERGTHQS